MAAPGWLRWYQRHKRSLGEATNMRIGKQLGCGAFGCAFEGDPGWVVKITSDEHEVHFATLMREMGPEKAPGSVMVHEVFRLEPMDRSAVPDGGQGPWAVVQERVAPFRKASASRYETLTPETVAMERHVGARSFWDTMATIRIYRDLSWNRVFEGALAPAEELADTSWTAAISETLQNLHKQGLVLADLHPGNLGWRTEGGLPYELVFYDPGATTWKGKPSKIEKRYVANGMLLRADFDAVADAAERIARSMGVEIRVEIGRGCFGIAFVTTDDRILKITGDKSEGHRANLAKGHPGAVAIDAVENYTIASAGLDVSAILEEAVWPLSSGGFAPRQYRMLTQLAREMSLAGENIIAGYEGVRQDYLDAADAIAEVSPRTEHLASLARHMLRQGYPLIDAHEGNLGVRPTTHDVVMVDLGGAEIDCEVEGPWAQYVANVGTYGSRVLRFRRAGP